MNFKMADGICDGLYIQCSDLNLWVKEETDQIHRNIKDIIEEYSKAFRYLSYLGKYMTIGKLCNSDNVIVSQLVSLILSFFNSLKSVFHQNGIR